MSKRTYQAIRAHVSGEYRTGTLYGKEYIVVPVTALVEGVIQGMSAEGPELALAEEFGRFPDSWNGRPIVMSHPVNKKGNPISANSPETLEEYSIGFIFNASLDSEKLILEAWVDPERMEALNDDSKETLTTLKAGTMIEVSTGYYAQLEERTGLYNNSEYQAIQRNIVPDHLAFLPNGTLGACSNADGCGAQLSVQQLRANQTKAFRVEQPCCGACADGDHTHCEDKMPKTHEEANEPTTQAEKDAMAKKRGKKGDPKTYEAPDPTLVAQAFPDNMLTSDACELVKTALRMSNGYSYIVGLTNDKVVYEAYDSLSGYYVTYQRSYDISADGVVTLGTDMQRVALVSKIIALNADGSEKESSMPEQTTQTAAPPAPAVNTEPKETVHKVTNDHGTLEVTVNEKGEPTKFSLTPKANAEPKKPQTTEEFIAQAPAEMQEVLSQSLKLHTEKKQGLIKALKDSGRCKFDDAYLEAQSVNVLEQMADLANVPSYAGRAAPISANANQSDDKVTPAPQVWDAPDSKTAA